VRACRAGIGRVHFLDRQADGAMLMEFFTRDGVGTVMTSAPLARLRDATVDDVGAILGLIEPLEADGTLVKRGRERLEMEITRFSVVEHDGVIVGCAAVYPFSTEKSAELACLAVMPDFRRSGYGDQLRSHIEARAKKLKLKRLFVLTTRTAHWFIERGFVEAGVDALPEARRELYNLQRRSKVLVKACRIRCRGLVNCIKLGREAEGLDLPPMPGEMGRKLYENVSKEAWQQWIKLQTMIINENRLSLADAQHRKYLAEQVQKHFFGDGADQVGGYVPPAK
jgi:N-acetylglutamate synthase-like GNAT family acetyltransferase/Fe-S cluster biosynthesis and repair protein YggX